MSFVPVRHVKRFNKYGAKKVWVCADCEHHTNYVKPEKGEICEDCGTGNWLRFDSKREHKYWADFRQLEKKGEIRDLKLHPVFPLTINGKTIGKYTADFLFIEGNRTRVIDVKSKPTAKGEAFRLRKAVVEAVYPWVDIEVVK